MTVFCICCTCDTIDLWKSLCYQLLHTLILQSDDNIAIMPNPTL